MSSIKNVLRSIGYQVKSLLGEGSFGTVLLCENMVDLSEVAIKITEKVQSYVSNETFALKTVKHPNIVDIYAVLETDKHAFTVMELAEGGNLLDLLAQESFSLSEERVKVIFSQLVEAVNACHQVGIAHRDLKLENVLLDLDGNVKLSDFGLCTRQEQRESSNTFCGTVTYSSPEVLTGEEYDAFKLDIWSLGVILYSLVCGSFPFDDFSISQMVQLQKDHILPFPEPISSECKDLILQMCQPDVAGRPSIRQVQNSSWLCQ
ncbi:testis-specific serine/threonine-protein kinase 3-like [Haliotis cracherodii]|uniref:testis-specific serine/threonine-protein kinase 3-like n=1 Tax=Haliotis cracherodii TaxID=6455 RepID=UPI0039EC1813